MLVASCKQHKQGRAAPPPRHHQLAGDGHEADSAATVTNVASAPIRQPSSSATAVNTSTGRAPPATSVATRRSAACSSASSRSRVRSGRSWPAPTSAKWLPSAPLSGAFIWLTVARCSPGRQRRSRGPRPPADSAGREARPRSGREVLDATPHGAHCSRRRTSRWRLRFRRQRSCRCVLQRRSSASGQAVMRAVGHPFAARGVWSAEKRCDLRESIKKDDVATRSVVTTHAAPPTGLLILRRSDHCTMSSRFRGTTVETRPVPDVQNRNGTRRSAGQPPRPRRLSAAVRRRGYGTTGPRRSRRLRHRGRSRPSSRRSCASRPRA
jgi:hypothetical protein